MDAVLRVSDFRESESWSIARSVVCAILDLTESWSKTVRSTRFGKKVKRLSIALLNEITRGYEGSGNPRLLAKAEETAEQIETELDKFRQEGILDSREFLMIRSDLIGVKRALNQAQTHFSESV